MPVTRVAIFPDGFEPPEAWDLITLRGGPHDGKRFWAISAPQRFQLIDDGHWYVRVAPTIWAYHAADEPEPAPEAKPTTDQMTLA